MTMSQQLDDNDWSKKVKSAWFSPKSLLDSLKLTWLDCEATPRPQGGVSERSLNTPAFKGSGDRLGQAVRKTLIKGKFGQC